MPEGRSECFQNQCRGGVGTHDRGDLMDTAKDVQNQASIPIPEAVIVGSDLRICGLPESSRSSNWWEASHKSRELEILKRVHKWYR